MFILSIRICFLFNPKYKNAINNNESGIDVYAGDILLSTQNTITLSDKEMLNEVIFRGSMKIISSISGINSVILIMFLMVKFIFFD